MASVLIIQDDDYFQSILTQTFERAGFDVLAASNGRAGIELFQSNPFDVVILDLVMPEWDGLETIQALKNIAPDAKIIAISGGGNLQKSANYLQMAKIYGAAITLTKPLDRIKVLKTLQDLLS